MESSNLFKLIEEPSKSEVIIDKWGLNGFISRLGTGKIYRVRAKEEGVNLVRDQAGRLYTCEEMPDTDKMKVTAIAAADAGNFVE